MMQGGIGTGALADGVKLRVAGASTATGARHRLWLPIRQTHKIFLHRLVTHEFGIPRKQKRLGRRERYVTIIVTRRPDAAAMFERS